MTAEQRLALVVSPTADARGAAEELRQRYDFGPIEEATLVVALGGDGFLLQTLHTMLDRHRILPVFGMNLGTVGFLMNEWNPDGLLRRIERARTFSVAPLRMAAITVDGERVELPAINEVSLLRETRQTAKLEVSVNDRVVMPELVCDGILAATPAGSTAYNLSANGPILPMGSAMLALTPISPFRPRRWRGALLPDYARIRIEVVDAEHRPVSAVADHTEFRRIAVVETWLDHETDLVLLHDPGHSLD